MTPEQYKVVETKMKEHLDDGEDPHLGLDELMEDSGGGGEHGVGGDMNASPAQTAGAPAAQGVVSGGSGAVDVTETVGGGGIGDDARDVLGAATVNAEGKSKKKCTENIGKPEPLARRASTRTRQPKKKW